METPQKAIGRLEAPDDLLAVLTSNDFQTLEITASHALLAGGSPRYLSDPFGASRHGRVADALERHLVRLRTEPRP